MSVLALTELDPDESMSTDWLEAGSESSREPALESGPRDVEHVAVLGYN